MKFILFNMNDTNKNTINKIEVGTNNYLSEISLSKSMIESLDEDKKSFVEKIKYKIHDKNIEKKIFKALDGHDKKWYYIFSNNMTNNKYLSNKIESMLGYKLTGANELDANVFKYVDEYLSQNNDKKLKKHELKVLLIATKNDSLNYLLINNLINTYKNVNIYLKEKPSSYTLKRLKQINKEHGTTIDIVRKERKALTEYNLIYFVDDIRENYPRLRFDKNSLIMDISLLKTDKFNSNILFINEYMSKNCLFSSKIENLMSRYNKIELASIIRKILNDLDKS